LEFDFYRCITPSTFRLSSPISFLFHFSIYSNATPAAANIRRAGAAVGATPALLELEEAALAPEEAADALEAADLAELLAEAAEADPLLAAVEAADALVAPALAAELVMPAWLAMLDEPSATTRLTMAARMASVNFILTVCDLETK
jgi:hypothetical protein